MSRIDISTCHLDYKSAKTQCQDKWIVDLTNAKTDGYFVEAGALDGIITSNTYVLEKQLNWQGICVEPIDRKFKQLIKNRKICENVCLYSKEGKIEFVESQTNPGWSGINKHIQIRKYKHDIIPINIFKTLRNIVKKQCLTLESLLDKHNAPNIIDYISLDTEGSEPEILKNFPFNKYTIMAFSIEGRYCSKLLKDKGYIQVENKFDELLKKVDYYYIHPNHPSIKL